MSAALKAIPLTIASGQSLSNGALLGDYTLCGINFPAGWTTAAVTFQLSFDDGATWVNLSDNTGTEVQVITSALASKYYALDPRDKNLAGLALIRLRSGTSATPVVQASAVTVNVVGRKMNAVAGN